MRIFKTRTFCKWADKEGLEDASLLAAVAEINNGLVDADLGGHIIKKRIAIGSKGKRGGVRTLLAYKVVDKAFFIYGFAKNVRANISSNELKALRCLAQELLVYSDKQLMIAINANVLIEVQYNG